MVFEFGVFVFEIGFGGEMHLLQLGGGDSIEAGAVNNRLAVFDFGEVDFVVFYTNDVDFVEVSFVVAGDDSVAVVY